MALYIFTGDGVVEYPTVDIYWGRSSRIHGALDLY